MRISLEWEKMRISLDRGAFIPKRSHENDAGLDLQMPSIADMIPVLPGSSVFVDTGVHVELPKNTVGLIMTRSGMNRNHDLHCEGVIDEGYRGSIGVTIYNGGSDYYMICPGDKIAQLLVVPVLYVECQAVESLDDTERGKDGFGSTGR